MLGESSDFSTILEYGCRTIIRQKANANPFFLLILLLVVEVNAIAQFESGTVVVIGYSHNKIIIAADSRDTEEDGTHHDDSCKITALNDKFFFAASGRISDMTHGIIGWDAVNQAKETFSAVPKELRTAKYIADYWAQLMDNRIDIHIRPEEKATLIPRHIFLSAVFAGIGPTGNTEIATSNVEPAMNGGRMRFAYTLPNDTNMGDEMNYLVIGDGAVLFNEFFYATSKRAKREKAVTLKESKNWPWDETDTRMLIRVIQLAIHYSGNQGHLGGKIDAAQLYKGGTIRWIQRKPNCPDN